jgi:hypothetical protein
MNDNGKLPNPDQAFIDLNKLIGYCLNPEHPEGQHKALVFKSALNIELNDMEILKNALLHAVKNNKAFFFESNQYGTKYTLEFEMTHQNKTATIKSAWMVRHNENFPRLITCYIL